MFINKFKKKKKKHNKTLKKKNIINKCKLIIYENLIYFLVDLYADLILYNSAFIF